MKRACFLLVLLFVFVGGLNAQPGTVFQFGNGCPGAAGIPVLDAAPGSLPLSGQQYTIQIAPLPPGSTAVCLMFSCVRLTTPVDLANIGMPGCSLWIAPEIYLGYRASGVFQKSLRIPRNPVYIGVAIELQALVLDESVGPLPVIITQGLQSTIGAVAPVR